MRAKPIWLLSAIMMAGCENSTNTGTDPNMRISFSECHTVAAKLAADSPKATSVYISKDSLDFTLESVSVQCQSEYVFSYAALSNGAQLQLDMDVSVNSGVRCLCAKDVTIGIKSKGEDFSGIKTVVLRGTEYDLLESAPNP
jgi:hypothetical protein